MSKSLKMIFLRQTVHTKRPLSKILSVIAIFYFCSIKITKEKTMSNLVFVGTSYQNTLVIYLFSFRFLAFNILAKKAFHVIQFVKVNFIQFAYGLKHFSFNLSIWLACVSGIFCLLFSSCGHLHCTTMVDPW